MIRTDPERLKPLLELPVPSSKRVLQSALGLFACYARWIPCFSDKIAKLKEVTTFPLNERCLGDFNLLKQCIRDASLHAFDENLPFVVECDASEVAISPTLNQSGLPIAFMSRSLSKNELHYPAVEKEATATIEEVRKWHHFIAGRHFTIATDQKSVSFMFGNRKRTKVKNNKIQCWRLELASFSYDIKYRPGRENNAPDALTRTSCSAVPVCNRDMLHGDLCVVVKSNPNMFNHLCWNKEVLVKFSCVYEIVHCMKLSIVDGEFLCGVFYVFD